MADMSEARPPGAATTPPARASRQACRAAAASLIGTTIEFYDFFIYGLAASLVFGSQFFPSFSPVAGTLAALSTFLVGFVARPIGAVVFGHFGDRVGRKRLLVISLLTAGGSTFVTGLLPTYAAIGAAAPILLVLCRLAQGLGLGGEWGGAVLMAVEHAPSRRRIVFGALPQMGNPAGLVLATVVTLVCSTFLPVREFQSWGWRIPFLLSVTLIVAGVIVRSRLRESPAFDRVRESRQLVRFPLGELVRKYPRALVAGTLAVTASPAVGLLVSVYLLPYGQRVLHISTVTMLLLTGVYGVVFFFAIWISAGVSERFGVRRVSVVGLVSVAIWAVPFFLLLDSRSLPAAVIAYAGVGVTVGAVNGPQATLLADLFPVRVRYSGASLTFQLSSVLGGAITPVVSTALLAATGSGLSIAVWVVAIAVISLVSVACLHLGSGVDPIEGQGTELAQVA
ncbi:MFS transporter [Pseudonocardia xinjiangensis]|uniref:MFS transporter n=1 Tax=Pseudonocardia xinjiangensis TaxID=75289 RepID=UPI003D923B66